MIIAQSQFVKSVDFAFFFIIAVSVFFLVLITGLMIFFVIKYNRKRNPHAKNIHGNTGLEILWTVVPTILVLFMFYFGWTGYKEMSSIPEDSMTVNVTAQMWKFSFKYDNGKTSDTLFVPVNKPVKVNLSSLDVNHAFYIPAFRLKKDVIPGRQNTAWFTATEISSHPIFCAEYCGLNHSYMYTEVVVLSESDFNVWVNRGVPNIINAVDKK
ncbi:MAG: cytochrome c oxidase subunit II [Ignavibacteriaceae bacterium]|nr:cytochrome c oxidase subunit II [Ignavibacteriaceae bacterium]